MGLLEARAVTSIEAIVQRASTRAAGRAAVRWHFAAGETRDEEGNLNPVLLCGARTGKPDGPMTVFAAGSCAKPTRHRQLIDQYSGKPGTEYECTVCHTRRICG
jgi:hypothetical protein